MAWPHVTAFTGQRHLCFYTVETQSITEVNYLLKSPIREITKCLNHFNRLEATAYAKQVLEEKDLDDH
jgi:hypothetical protein